MPGVLTPRRGKGSTELDPCWPPGPERSTPRREQFRVGTHLFGCPSATPLTSRPEIRAFCMSGRCGPHDRTHYAHPERCRSSRLLRPVRAAPRRRRLRQARRTRSPADEATPLPQLPHYRVLLRLGHDPRRSRDLGRPVAAGPCTAWRTKDPGRNCPVIESCFAWAMTHGDAGIWGGQRPDLDGCRISTVPPAKLAPGPTRKWRERMNSGQPWNGGCDHAGVGLGRTRTGRRSSFGSCGRCRQTRPATSSGGGVQRGQGDAAAALGAYGRTE